MHDHEDPQEQIDRFASRDESLKEFLTETAKRINTAIDYIKHAVADDSESSSSSSSDSDSASDGEHNSQSESNTGQQTVNSPQDQLESDEDIPALESDNENKQDNNSDAVEQNNEVEQNNAVEQNNDNAAEQNNVAEEQQPNYATMSHDRALNVLTERHGAEIAEDVMTLAQNMGISIPDSILILSNNNWNLINALSLLM